MGRRLKQIKHSEIHGFEKKVIASLIDGKPKIVKEEKHESIRCKVEIFSDSAAKKELIDSFTINTTSLEATISDIVSKYGVNVQFIITNLYDEKIVAKRFAYVGGGGKDISNAQDILNRIQKLKEDGKTLEEVYLKIYPAVAKSYIKEIYDSIKVEPLKIEQSLITEDLNTNKTNTDNSNLKEQNKVGEIP